MKHYKILHTNIQEPSNSKLFASYQSPPCVKKVLSDSPGLVDFAVRLVDSVCHLHDRRVKFLGKFFEEFKLQIEVL